MENSEIITNLIKQHKWDEIKKFLEKLKETEEIELNIRDENNNFLIIYPIVQNKLEITKLFIEKGAKIDIFDGDGRSILYIPIKFNYYDMFKLLIEYNNKIIGLSIINMKDHYFKLPIHYALSFKNYNMIKTLIDAGSNMNVMDNSGHAPIHLAVYSRDWDIFKLIISNESININMTTDIEGETALHIATNFQLDKFVEELIKSGSNVNAQDKEFELTPLIYSVNLNNKNILDKLLNNNDIMIDLQDYMGNTAIHYLIIEENYNLFDKIYKFNPNLNLYNIHNKLPIHLALEKTNINNEILNKLIQKSNLNFQDNEGITPLHILIKKNLWKSYVNELKNKKMYIFVKDKNGKRPIDHVQQKDLDNFINLVVDSYQNILIRGNHIWENEWENLCSKKNLTKEDIKKCKEKIRKKIIDSSNSKNIGCSDKSYPLKKNKTCISVSEGYNFHCYFTGITLDILIGLIYLLNKYKDACSTIPHNFKLNKNLCEYYKMIGIMTDTKCEFLNFEIVWINKKLFFSDNFFDHFKKCIDKKNIRFIIIPLGIEMKEGSHANYLIYDKKFNEIERFEPYGHGAPMGLNYNVNLLDELLKLKFTDINYISPTQFLPKIGFQYLDVIEKKTKKIGDPEGFCALWSIWYTDMRLTYPDIKRTKLVKKLIKQIKLKNLSYKNLIRNYAKNVVEIRDNIFKKTNIDINDWLNDQYTEAQFNEVIAEISKLIIS